MFAMKDLRTEIFRRMYEEPVHPRNLWLNDDPQQHADVDEIYRANIGRLIARGSFTPPARAFPGARYIAPAESPEETDWEQVRSLWSRPRMNSPLHASVNSWRTMAGSLLAGVSRTRRRLSLPGRK
jgi:beta-ureidopropionase